MSAIEEGRGFFGIIIPAEILDSAELSIAEKFIYGFIASFTKACFMSNEAIATRLGVSEATVSRAINSLKEMGYVYVEFIKGNNAKRLIYSVFDNPKKLKYLASKGMFDKEKFSTGYVKLTNPSSQIDETSSQIDETNNGGESRQIDDHRYRINIEESAQARGKAKKEPSTLPRKSDFATNEEWEKAFYERTTVSLPNP